MIGSSGRLTAGIVFVASLLVLPAAMTLLVVQPAAAAPGDALFFDSASPGRLDLVFHHQMDAGRLIVRVSGHAVYSAPFRTVGEGDAGRVAYPLSIPIGPHTVAVQLIDRRGRLVAEDSTEGTVPGCGSAGLLVDEHRGTGDGLTLTWRAP